MFNYSVFVHRLKVHAICDLNFIVKDEGLLKVTGSHIHGKVVKTNKENKWW